LSAAGSNARTQRGGNPLQIDVTTATTTESRHVAGAFGPHNLLLTHRQDLPSAADTSHRQGKSNPQTDVNQVDKDGRLYSLFAVGFAGEEDRAARKGAPSCPSSSPT
jgi:hypothetical protein